MSSMVGGTDVIFETARQGFSIGLLLGAVLDVWPDAQVQEADSDIARPLTESVAHPPSEELEEFFIYKDPQSAKSWANDGWTEEYANDLVHVLVVEEAPRPDTIQVTLVIGAFTGETLRLVVAVFEALRDMTPGASVEPRLLVAR